MKLNETRGSLEASEGERVLDAFENPEADALVADERLSADEYLQSMQQLQNRCASVVAAISAAVLRAVKASGAGS